MNYGTPQSTHHNNIHCYNRTIFISLFFYDYSTVEQRIIIFFTIASTLHSHIIPTKQKTTNHYNSTGKLRHFPLYLLGLHLALCNTTTGGWCSGIAFLAHPILVLSIHVSLFLLHFIQISVHLQSHKNILLQSQCQLWHTSRGRRTEKNPTASQPVRQTIVRLASILMSFTFVIPFVAHYQRTNSIDNFLFYLPIHPLPLLYRPMYFYDDKFTFLHDLNCNSISRILCNATMW